MTFLQPLILFGLVAAAIPVVLHLLTLRRLRVVDFSTLSFLKELQRSRIRKVRLRQLLLLILRTLIIILLVIAFSRPTLEGSVPAGLGSTAKTSAVLIIDDSYSMTAQDEHGELLKQARTAALRILDECEEGDDITLLPISQSEAIDGRSSTRSRIPSVVRQEISAIRPTAVTRNLDAALRAAAVTLASSQNPNKEVYVLSDFQRSLLPPAAGNRELVFDGSTRFFEVPFGDKQQQNLSLTDLICSAPMAEPGKPVEVKSSVSHRGATGTMPANVSVFLEGERLDQRVRDVASGTTSPVSLSATPRKSGLLTGVVRLEGDDLEFDNVQHFALRLPKELRVLLIGSEPDVRFIRLALTARAGSSSTVFRLNVVEPTRLTAAAMTGYDVLVFASSSPLSSDLVSRLRASVLEGMGIVLMPGSHESVTAAFSPILNAFGGSVTENASTVSATGGSFLTFRSVDRAHPLISGMFDVAGTNRTGEPSQKEIESPEILRRVGLRLPSGSSSLIALSDGQPFLSDLRAGTGRVLVFSSGMTREWSDLPVRGLFVPLIHRVVSYLAQEQAVRPLVRAGQEVTIQLPGGTRGRIRIVTPDRQEVSVSPVINPSGSLVRFGDTRIPGVYSVFEGATEIDRFAVNIAQEEGDTAPADEVRKSRLWEELGVTTDRVRTIDPQAGLETSIREARFGTELWRWFLGFALALAVIELMLASYLRTTPQGGTTA